MDQNKKLTADEPGTVDDSDPIELNEAPPGLQPVDPPAGWEPAAHDYTEDPAVQVTDDGPDAA